MEAIGSMQANPSSWRRRTGIMSMIGFAAKPGTDVLPT
jgi:hypothetical protein